ncbi:hypothetical protein L596_018583 [Steinernema carpocapsae]|uniref:Secreted protein n=1 Tax=Steinernema carpocapsae TaxID=34508 RepID=A0A4U5N5X5_STECR|nr:hypothetical protein L596_018583 [Steinernema carpocapsae]
MVFALKIVLRVLLIIQGGRKKCLARHLRSLTRQKCLIPGVRGADDRSVSRYLLAKPTGRSQRVSLK